MFKRNFVWFFPTPSKATEMVTWDGMVSPINLLVGKIFIEKRMP